MDALNPEGRIKVQICTMVASSRSLHWLVLILIQSFGRGSARAKVEPKCKSVKVSHVGAHVFVGFG
jgi:hypothetical protein